MARIEKCQHYEPILLEMPIVNHSPQSFCCKISTELGYAKPQNLIKKMDILLLKLVKKFIRTSNSKISENFSTKPFWGLFPLRICGFKPQRWILTQL